jgi:hypothetical protein
MWDKKAFLAILLILGCCLWGCKQGLGDRCQVPSDCDEGLTCCLKDKLWGTCQPDDKCSSSQDASVEDAKVKDGSTGEGKTIDKSVDSKGKDLSLDQAPKDLKPLIDQKPAKDLPKDSLAKDSV